MCVAVTVASDSGPPKLMENFEFSKLCAVLDCVVCDLSSGSFCTGSHGICFVLCECWLRIVSLPAKLAIGATLYYWPIPVAREINTNLLEMYDLSSV